MSHADRISSLEEERTRAKKDAKPVIVEHISDDRDQQTTFGSTPFIIQLMFRESCHQ